jgi:sugar phosphate isomerase/epimerase
MTPRPTRRDFFRAALAAGLSASAAAGIEPIRWTGKPKLTASLAAYSYNRYLDLRGKKKPQMTLEEFIDLGAGLKLPAVELTAYYFPRTTDDYLKSVKARCNGHGLAVSGTAIGNDFCWPDRKKQQEQLDHVKRWIEHSALLGAKTMRIFAGSVRKGDTQEEARKRAVELIQKACEYAGEYPVKLALENHGGITATAEQLLAIVKAVKSDSFGVNLDTGNFHTPDPYDDLARAAPYAIVVQIKTEVLREKPGKDGGKKSLQREEADLKRVTDLLRKVGYQGYVALEYEAKEDPKTAVPRYVKELKKLMG